jgi:hypothetical protein
VAATTSTRKRATPRKRVPAKTAVPKPEPRKRHTGKPGRPSLLTPKTAKAILDGIRNGLYIEYAVRAAGVSKATYYSWMARARKELERIEREQARLDAMRSEGLEPDEPEPSIDPEELPYLEFLDAAEQAEAECMQFHVDNLQRIAKSKSDLSSAARASLNVLERRWPRLWSRAERSEVSVTETANVFVEVHTVEEQKERTRETLDVLDAINARGVIETAVGARELPSGGDEDDDD